MRVDRIGLERFRNFSGGEVFPCGGINALTGDNAQGKTNLLEAVWMFTGCRSFRAAKDAEVIPHGETAARLELDFFARERAQTASLWVESGSQLTLNGVKEKSLSAMAGVFCAVVFAPLHLDLIREGPAERRKFLDGAIAQLSPGYRRLTAEYHRALTQRNTILKDMSRFSGLEELMEVWEERLSQLGGRIEEIRARYLDRLIGPASEFYGRLSGGREQLGLCRISSGEEAPAPSGREEAAARLLARLRAARGEDLRAGTTTVGPHRDDLSITINGVSARAFGSQGQQRSAALALKLAEAEVLREVFGEPPVVLLDDVLSELDAGRQDFVLNHIRTGQVFLTCCDREQARRLDAGALFEVRGGVVARVNGD